MSKQLITGRCVHKWKPVTCYGECGTHCPIWYNYTCPDPVATWTPNPKEYAGEADAIKNGQAYSGILADADTRAFQETPQPKPAIKFASIAPRYPGDNVKRAPIEGDTHACKKHFPAMIYEIFSIGVWRMGGEIIRHGMTEEETVRGPRYPCAYCPHCGGLLPTVENHE